MLLTAKTALITGAANRLGAQIARTLHQNGANLIIHYRRSKTAALALIDELNRIRPDSATAIAADLSQSGATEMLAENALQFNQRLDLLINNASSFYPTPVGDITESNWNDLINSNFKAPLFLAQACYPALKQTSGNIINMIDIYATKPLAQHSVYCAAKAANQMLVKSLALELAPDVRVNGIAPGAILWPQEDGDEASAAQQRILDQIPLQRRGTPESIAQVALMLATNSYITGEIIKVDGGRMLT